MPRRAWPASTGGGRAPPCPGSTATRSFPGLLAPATIRRDALGAPHIQAGSTLDAVRAQGYATAQDRLWQMDLLRRRARGELAEAFGEGALRADREVRTLGLGHVARASLGEFDPDSRALLEAYAAGVNAFIASHRDALPLEFRLLRYGPRLWEAADTIAVGKLLALDLAQGWEAEAFRATVETRCPPRSRTSSSRACFPTTASCSARAPASAGGDADTPLPTKTTRAAATTGSSPGPTPRPGSRYWQTTRTSVWRALDLDRGPPHGAGPGRCGGDAARGARA